jgi:hypothetical protein
MLLKKYCHVLVSSAATHGKIKQMVPSPLLDWMISVGEEWLHMILASQAQNMKYRDIIS